MKIRNRLTMQFAGIFSLLLVLFSLVISDYSALPVTAKQKIHLKLSTNI